MKTAILAILFLRTLAFAHYVANLQMLPGERWWAGVISESHLMPFTDTSRYNFDFEANTAGNQGQPLLITDKGRFLRCDQPFSFRIANVEIHADSKFGPITSGAHGGTLREVYRQCQRVSGQDEIDPA